MSALTSTSAPRSGSISDDGFFAFDGAEALLRAWGGGLRPDLLLTVSEWAARAAVIKHIYALCRSGIVAGRRTGRTVTYD